MREEWIVKTFMIHNNIYITYTQLILSIIYMLYKIYVYMWDEMKSSKKAQNLQSSPKLTSHCTFACLTDKDKCQKFEV